MRSRRRFLTTATLGVAGLASLTDDAIARVSAAASGVADRTPDDVARDESFWREIQLGFARRSQHHQLEQRRRLPQPARRARSVQAVSGRLESVARLSHVAGARAEQGNRPPPPRRQHRRRPRRARADAQRQRGAADRAARPRSRARRRSADDDAGLRAHARYLGTAGRARQDRAEEDPVPGAAAEPRGSRAAHRKAAITREDESDSLLPHHQPDGADFPGAATSADWRARAASRRSSTARTRTRSFHSRSATSSAISTARACTSGCSRRWAPASSTCGAIASPDTGR